MIAGKKRGYLYVRLRITRAFLADGISRRKERINQKNTGVITALLFSRWRVIGQGGREGGRRAKGSRGSTWNGHVSAADENASVKLVQTRANWFGFADGGRDEKREIVALRGVVVQPSRGDRGNDTRAWTTVEIDNRGRKKKVVVLDELCI